MPKRLAALCLLVLVPVVQAEELSFSGYYKNLLVRSETVVPAGQAERYTLDLNRLRLELKGSVSEAIALDLQYDNEVLLGSYLDTGQFALQNEERISQYRKYGDGGSWYGRQRFYRAAVTVSAGSTDVRVGRQRVAWGTGRFWNPVDLLNPINPIALEREERIGVDAALAEHKLGPLSRVSAVYAPSHDGVESSAALNWHSNAAGTDYSLIGGRFESERVAGGDLATQLGGMGVRAELTRNAPDAGSTYGRALFALDYAFPNTLTLSGELYYNGAGAADRSSYDFASLFAGRIQNVGRRYFGGYLAYEITPLVKSANYVVVNVSDHSSFFSPTVSFSLRASLDFTLGVQIFSGSTGSEYGMLSDVYYAQAQWFF
jgi:hypothetical protein